MTAIHHHHQAVPILVLLHLVLVIFLVIGARKAVADDATTLLAFKNSSMEVDPGGYLDNWVGANACSWTGVTCGTDGRVSVLALRDLGLSGRLSIDDLMALPSLLTVDLSGNAFRGDLSRSSSMPVACAFQTVDLSRNNFSEPATGGLFLECTNLRWLNLSGNAIPGGGMYPLVPSLQSLDLSRNRISDVGLLDAVLSSCQNLRYLNVSVNHLAEGLTPPATSYAFLEVLDLSYNPFSAWLPARFVASMPESLTHLALAGSNLTGDFSAADFGACQNLVFVDLSGNLLAGGPPASISNCQRLKWLDLSNNRFTGGIPSYLSTLGSIWLLSLAGNQLTGEIPPELSQLCGTLTELDLSENALTGGLPSSFASCTSLQVLDLRSNQLSGDFMGTVVSTLPSMRSLLVTFNNISGPAPLPQLMKCSTLEVIDMGGNELTGEIPWGLCAALPSLRRLSLPDNYMTGELPEDLGDCVQLVGLDLSFNMLEGRIPARLLELPGLKYVAMWANRLSGEIPDVLCSDGGALEMLVLNYNQLTGKIPPSISRCRFLMWLSLGGNKLSGEIPTTLGDMEELAILQLGHNNLTGQIPESLGQCPKLIWLDVFLNRLTGPIPATLSAQTGKVTPAMLNGFRFAFLRNEAGTKCPGSGFMFEFEGIRRARLAAYKRVHLCPWTRIYVREVMYTFRSNGSMIYLDLSHNSLSGQIPDTLGIMPYLIVLNLGHNQLTGQIPRSFGGLKSIGVIDVSHNNLSGPIPGELTTLSFLNDLDLSNNNLSGRIPTSGQFMTFPASRFENNTFLCGKPLQPCSSSSNPTSPPHSVRTKRAFRRRLFIVVFTGIFVCMIVIIFVLLLILWRRRKERIERNLGFVDSLSKSRSDPWAVDGQVETLSITMTSFEKPLKKLTFGHLLEATNGFNAESLIGTGGFGQVYRATLKDGIEVAIKKLMPVANQGDREFTAEMETIGKIKHRNLVPLLGYCKVGEERLLVYEFMKYGSLDDVLHGRGIALGADVKLDWAARKKIAIGAGRGLAFLHHMCIPHIIHRDMKSSNVLIDEAMEARVADFGMARLVNSFETHLSVSTLAGSPGYVPPEYYQSFRCTARGDVYSFGVILLELLSGKPALNVAEFGDANLVGWAKQLIKNGRTEDVFDPELLPADHEPELEQWLTIALHCLEDRPNRRPTMAQVMAKFKELQPDYFATDGNPSDDSLDLVELDEES